MYDKKNIECKPNNIFPSIAKMEDSYVTFEQSRNKLHSFISFVKPVSFRNHEIRNMPVMSKV